ncbi:hypothetical protein F0562_009372 [Nyssa sinensis]|uniref:Uncharacterized protein n=1 Tax=Nyssa sinensis TaxID=561372 RepID=A0A5J4ZY24_9ASTE|nr:hypothetical protein F0562_009372 [Nyssa sinensis]
MVASSIYGRNGGGGGSVDGTCGRNGGGGGVDGTCGRNGGGGGCVDGTCGDGTSGRNGSTGGGPPCPKIWATLGAANIVPDATSSAIRYLIMLIT